ncbi:hypothetical protein NPIL_91531 [Nephila pilipes]|uniref:Uncharacterized protein n=1 Tax=Nephila pilipes TaxID=299642 RepID=A0A8X6NWI2_NEPPI|nr:hypothetical protein NPIL_91531 [Nephila pilipes]
MRGDPQWTPYRVHIVVDIDVFCELIYGRTRGSVRWSLSGRDRCVASCGRIQAHVQLHLVLLSMDPSIHWTHFLLDSTTFLPF